MVPHEVELPLLEAFLSEGSRPRLGQAAQAVAVAAAVVSLGVPSNLQQANVGQASLFLTSCTEPAGQGLSGASGQSRLSAATPKLGTVE